MKTLKLTSAIATLSLVLFMSIASIANSVIYYSGDLPKSGDKSLNASSTTNSDYSYLRFDVKNYVNENESAEATYIPLDYVRFDVNEFVTEADAVAMELPMANEFEYLHFDVNNFIENNTDNMIDSPVNELGYLRFDVNNFTKNNADNMIALPINEFDYLRFDVDAFLSTANAINDELPVTE